MGLVDQCLTEIPRVRVISREQFDRILKAAKPAILEGLDFGPCVKDWTIDHLKQKIGADREVILKNPMFTFIQC